VDEEEAMALMQELPDWEFQAFVALDRHLTKATEARLQQTRGEIDVLRHAARLHERAQELDPTMDKNATLEEAIEVLRRHGEPLGISEEVLEMVIEVPPDEELRWREED